MLESTLIFLFDVKTIANLLGVDEFLPSSELFDLLGQQACKENSTSIYVCDSILFLICGPDISELDQVDVKLYGYFILDYNLHLT